MVRNMKSLKEVLEFISENANSIESNQEIMSVAYVPDDRDSFKIIYISFDREEFEENGTLFFSIFISGGSLHGVDGTEDHISGSFDELLNDAPEFLKNLKYKIMLDLNVLWMHTAYALKEIFKELPCPDDIYTDSEAEDFKKKAIECIAKFQAE